ncbi:hypothetical protein [Streptomyces sp. NRRL S-1022]|nr:hypothetical protein [Streptomyces sp. NRRL S-1022]
MSVPELTCTAPPDAADAVSPDRVAWPEEQYDMGFSGPRDAKSPATAG